MFKKNTKEIIAKIDTSRRSPVYSDSFLLVLSRVLLRQSKLKEKEKSQTVKIYRHELIKASGNDIPQHYLQ